MDDLLYSLRYAIPSIVVFVTAFVLLREFFRSEQRRRNQALLLERMRVTIPLRLQAYERIVLLLERISPHNLVMRLHQPGLSAAGMQRLLVQSIREEFSHNLSQQLYVSVQAWQLLEQAKEEMVGHVNAFATGLGEGADAMELCKHLLEMDKDSLPTTRAMTYIKNEAGKIL
jgi:hypothetical protein